MERKEDEGLILTVQRSEAQNGVVHAEPCDCHEMIQVGANNKQVLSVIEQMLGDLASQHNAIIVGCSECGWEGFIGPGDKAVNDGNKAVVNESSCPECEGKLISLERETCDHNTDALEPFYDEEELTGNEK